LRLLLSNPDPARTFKSEPLANRIEVKASASASLLVVIIICLSMADLAANVVVKEGFVM
jgi:hypothetical protein